ncbi:CDP-glycerol glycerophosphotransferase family protein [Fictibacillus sp. B-59209]|uniref:CDP-glycerol glycerophosphotransferase family protein n=1 Tax=Fictibacillus sp. B-59209 TaxID=3024873 RepID=UPI002E23A8EF|nr:CDP-glycerol glycerophosphotransferase family protein [Fictibacillus sp. B-59209]
MEQRVFSYHQRGSLVLSDDYCVFNGTKSINKKKKSNMKYYVYSQETGEKINFPDIEPLTILQTIRVPRTRDERVVFFVDTKGNLSFIKTRQKSGVINRTLEKLEKTPLFRSMVLLLFYRFLFIGVMRFRNYSFTEAYLAFGYDKSVNVKIHFLFPLKVRERFAMNTGRLAMLVHAYWSIVPMKDIYQHYVETSEINTPVYIRLTNEDYDFWFHLKSDSRHVYSKRHYLYNTGSFRLRKLNSELFIRKSITGQYVIVITSMMSKWIVLKEAFAYLFALFSFNKKKYDIYFEKFSAGASESAFELFKFAYKQGNPCIYILEKSHPDYQAFKQQFGKSFVAKNSFWSFYYIFRARSFQSSDLVSHIQRRLYDNDYYIKKKVLSTDKKIMLQHGPSLATNIFERGYFNRKVPIAPDYLLVNSNYEKDLFLNHTQYSDHELMVTGLPNLDLYVKEKNTQKSTITFMLTWRPWDLTGKIEEGSYLDRYLSFIKLIQDEEFYHDKKINIVLHPKSKIILKEQFPEIYDTYESSFFVGDIKDALLSSKVVISDYSSITYYAFAGGSNVIFYWEDKELAEAEYGAPNILQKEIAFGDIAETFRDLHSKIVNSYSNTQTYYHISQYSRLIECTNGRNTGNTYNHIQKYIINENKPVSWDTERKLPSNKVM